MPRTGDGHFSSFGLPPPPPRPPSQVQDENRHQSNEIPNQAASLPGAAVSSESQPRPSEKPMTSPRPLGEYNIISSSLHGHSQRPKKYWNTRAQITSLEPSAVTKESLNSTKMQGVKSQESSESTFQSQAAKNTMSGQINGSNQVLTDAQPATNSSFYWHSPQSSTDTTLNRSPLLPAIDEAGDFSLSKKSSNTAGPDPVLYGASASALGFGGPSDWEHFGDYNAEVIDDTYLYTTKSKKDIPHPQEAVELSTIASPIQAADGKLPKSKIGAVADELANSSRKDTLNEGLTAGTPESGQIAEEPVQGVNEVPENISIDVPHNSHQRDHSASSTQSANSTPDQIDMLMGENGKDLQGVEAVAINTKPLANMPEHHVEQSQPQTLVLPSEILPIKTPPTDDEEETAILEQQNNQMEEKIKAQSDGDPSEKPSMQPEEQVGTEGSSQGFIQSPHVENEHSGFDDNEQEMESEKGPVDFKDKQGHTVDLEDDGREDIYISLEVPSSSEDEIIASAIPDDQELCRVNGSLTIPTHQSEFPTRSSPENDLPSTSSNFSKSIELDDPYANLDPWAKASLNRYVKMLHKESQAIGDDEKYMVFIDFMRRESRLRAVLYDVDDEPEPLESVVKRIPLKESTSILTLRPSVQSKALPALPPGANRRRDSIITMTSPQSKDRSMRESGKVYDRSDDMNASTKLQTLQEQTSFPQPSSDESYVMIDASADEQYTPGGGPVTDRQDSKATTLKITPSLTSLRRALDIVANEAKAAFGKDTRSPIQEVPAVFQANVEKGKLDSDTPRSSSVPPLTADRIGQDTPSSISDHDEGHPYEGDKATNRQTIYRPFSMSLRPGSIKSQTVNGEQSKDSMGASSNSQLKNDDKDISETDLTASKGIEFDSRRFDSQPPSETPTRGLNEKNSILGPLLVVVPRTNILRPETEQISNIKRTMDNVPDDFDFYHKSVTAWNAGVKDKRAQYEHERHSRQGEFEQRIDALFNEHQIGYGDIPELEAEFKQAEAAKKAHEDRIEFQSFVVQVFDGVWARLHYEIDKLNPLYETCSSYVKDASAGRDMFEDPDDRVPIASATENLLILYQKLSIRYQKAFEAVLERDRRLKKIEVAPWDALGNIKQIKKIEQRFEEAEKTAILGFRTQHDERTNALMDVLDKNTIHGVETNQAYMESVMKAVRGVAATAACSNVLGDTQLLINEVLKAKTITTTLTRSSKTALHTFHVVDMLLNASNYDVSVAEAHVRNAKPEEIKKLKASRDKEDQKLVRDLEHKLYLIRCNTTQTLGEIAKLLSLAGSKRGAENEGKKEEEVEEPSRT